ncbi:hypothetical protein SETIT_4G000100v2 [Setaria italica]|uniref:Pollen allergen Poa p IX/Phl p VI domain-containing protein n=1 Tax=Setaria italica TaxID=4555 RepID=A0A368QP50_SETIT|nr:hypothetical protein SETIT_4G000100v2 [Setaria italica]
MAKIILVFLSLIFAIVAAAEASSTQQPLSPATKKSIDDLTSATKKDIDDLTLLFQEVTDAINTATPPAKKPEATQSDVAKAAKAGDEEKLAHLILAYRMASAMVIHAPPAERLKVMEDTFNSAAAPNPYEYPNVDKAYCETRSKFNKAILGVVAAASPEQKKLWDKDSTLPKSMHTAMSTVNKAYADGDDKEIARVLAAYNKAADSVIAAPPSDKLKVMESTFKHAAASGA